MNAGRRTRNKYLVWHMRFLSDMEASKAIIRVFFASLCSSPGKFSCPVYEVNHGTAY